MIFEISLEKSSLGLYLVVLSVGFLKVKPKVNKTSEETRPCFIANIELLSDGYPIQKLEIPNLKLEIPN